MSFNIKVGILEKYKKLNKISIYFVQLSMDFEMPCSVGAFI